jgi:Flavin containing amine oxidoreductase
MVSAHVEAIVIGAGAAGLAAARVLVDAGTRVVVLEGRDRVGGRLFTDRTLCELPIDLGGELIHGSRVVTWEIVRALGLPTRPMTTLLVLSDGALAPFDDGDLGDIDPRALLEPVPGETRARWLERAGVTRSQWPPIFRFLDADGEPFDRVSALAPIAQLAENPDPDAYGAADFVLMGGYDEVLQPLREGLDIRFGHVVTTWHGPTMALQSR